MLFFRTSALLTVALAVTNVLAFATGKFARDLWSPHISYPSRGIEISIGAVVKVIWDTHDAPDKIDGGSKLCLVKGGSIVPKGYGSLEHPIAKDFDLKKGSYDFTLPKDIEPADDYRLALLGSSDNWSEEFKIKK